MPSKRLPNYLRTYRRRNQLSQAELAQLLGCKDGGKVSRYERRTREPALRTLLAYELILGVPLRELFAGIYEEVEIQTKKHAKALLKQLQLSDAFNIVRQSKVDLLQRIAACRTSEGTQ